MSITAIADQPSTVFDRRFLAFFAIYITTIGMAYVFLVTFMPVPKDSQQYASTALGFILGVLISAPIGFFYGASKMQPTAPPSAPIPVTVAPAASAAPTLLADVPDAPKGTPDDPVSIHEVGAKT